MAVAVGCSYRLVKMNFNKDETVTWPNCTTNAASRHSTIWKVAVPSRLAPAGGPEQVSRLMPRILLDLQNRGQLAGGFTTYNPHRDQLLDTHKQIGTVIEAFRLSHQAKYDSIMREYAGRAAIGHVRYATCGTNDRNHAQPFERYHGCKWKWFSFAFNGQLANFAELRDELLDTSGLSPHSRLRHGSHHALPELRAPQ